MLAPERLAQLRAEREAVENAAMLARMGEVHRLGALRALGRTLAAERMTWAQMNEIRDNTHKRYRSVGLVPGVSFETEQEWREFCRGVAEVWAQV